ncbi:MAG: hypothetical protein ACC634_06280 [Hyphomicrobiales bacterium]
MRFAGAFFDHWSEQRRHAGCWIRSIVIEEYTRQQRSAEDRVAQAGVEVLGEG